MAEQILAYARGAAAGARQAGILSVPSLVTGVGVGLTPKVREFLASNKSVFSIYKSLKEWAPATLGIGLGVLWELLKKRLGNLGQTAKYLDYAVYGIVGGLIGQSVSTLIGEPFAAVIDGKLYVKNMNPPQGENRFIVLVDGQRCDAAADEELPCLSSLSEGAHDLVVAGDKAYYWKQYIEVSQSSTQTSAKLVVK